MWRVLVTLTYGHLFPRPLKVHEVPPLKDSLLELKVRDSKLPWKGPSKVSSVSGAGGAARGR
jgi:hypothetical protein